MASWCYLLHTTVLPILQLPQVRRVVGALQLSRVDNTRTLADADIRWRAVLPKMMLWHLSSSEWHLCWTMSFGALQTHVLQLWRPSHASPQSPWPPAALYWPPSRCVHARGRSLCSYHQERACGDLSIEWRLRFPVLEMSPKPISPIQSVDLVVFDLHGASHVDSRDCIMALDLWYPEKLPNIPTDLLYQDTKWDARQTHHPWLDIAPPNQDSPMLKRTNPPRRQGWQTWMQRMYATLHKATVAQTATNYVCSLVSEVVTQGWCLLGLYGAKGRWTMIISGSYVGNTQSTLCIHRVWYRNKSKSSLRLRDVEASIP